MSGYKKVGYKSGGKSSGFKHKGFTPYERLYNDKSMTSFEKDSSLSKVDFFDHFMRSGSWSGDPARFDDFSYDDLCAYVKDFNDKFCKNRKDKVKVVDDRKFGHGIILSYRGNVLDDYHLFRGVDYNDSVSFDPSDLRFFLRDDMMNHRVDKRLDRLDWFADHPNVSLSQMEDRYRKDGYKITYNDPLDLDD